MRIRNIFIAVLVALSMLMVAFSASPAKAQSSGSFNATSIQEWQGNMNGALSYFWIDNPTLGNGEHWERYIEIATATWNHVEQFGVEKCGSSGAGCPICGSNGPGLFEFFYTSEIHYTQCFKVPSDAINTQMGFSIYENTNDPGIVEFQIFNGPNDMPCNPGECPQRTGYQTWYHIQLKEVIKATFTGHKVWGGEWSANQWMNSGYHFNYQTNAGFIRQGPGNPPQMGWNIASYSYPPAPGNSGGVLASCDYDTGTRCYARA